MPANAQKTYPVLYLFDGQFVLPACRDTAWLPIDEDMPKLIENGKLRPIIVVGIDSATHRSHEYFPFRDWFEEPLDNPIGQSIPRFLAREVIPFVSARYRVTNKPEDTGVGGVSDGAVAALYALLTRPDLFGIGMLESPMLQDGNGELVRQASALARGPDRVYIGIGTEETRIPGGEVFSQHFRITTEEANQGIVKLCESLAANLQNAYFKQPHIHLVVQPGASHDSKFWRERFPDAIAFLYGRGQ